MARLTDDHGPYLRRLALLIVRGGSPGGVVTVSIARYSRRAAGVQSGSDQERRDLTRVFLRVCSDLETVQPAGRSNDIVPRSMTWLSELVVLRRLARALTDSESLSDLEVADCLGITPATVSTLLRASDSGS